MKIVYRLIGTIQPTGQASAPGTAEVLTEFAAGLKDLEGFSLFILLYHLHKVHRVDLTVTPFLGSEQHGVFATRAHTRPNPIGLSIVPLLRIEGNRLNLGNVDILDGTPLLDIRPFVAEFDQPADARAGWLEAVRGKVQTARSDERFS